MRSQIERCYAVDGHLYVVVAISGIGDGMTNTDVGAKPRKTINFSGVSAFNLSFRSLSKKAAEAPFWYYLPGILGELGDYLCL